MPAFPAQNTQNENTSMPPRSPRFVTLGAPTGAATREEIAAGLSAPSAAIAPKHFYDALGSHLFAAITELDEYYPTRTEAAIMAAETGAIARAFGGAGATIVDLGASDCAKGARLFEAFAPRQYVAVDISVDYLRDALGALQRRFPAMDLLGVGTDFSQRLVLPPEVAGERRLFFYPGSSIGNFTPAEAVQFLAQVRALAGGDGALLIGVDLVKDTATLEAAYDDAIGVTAAFNLNLLRHVNRLAGTDFAPPDWRHVARFDVPQSRIEMYLEARRAIVVRWPGGERAFAAGERIHTENSYKYTEAAFAEVLARAGFDTAGVWTDPRRWFGVFLARAAV